MDPDEALKNAREALARVRAALDEKLVTYGFDAVGDFADAFEALDTWLTDGGFPPGDWHHPAAHLKQSEEGH